MKKIILSALMLISVSAIAIETKISTQNKTEIKSSESSETHILNNKELADAWGLTETDIVKYKKVMQGPWGTFSPGIAPPLTLALDTKNSQERRRYVAIYAKLAHDRTLEELQVARLYHEVFNELYPDKAIKKEVLFQNEEYMKDDDRFVIFINSECKDCTHLILTDLIKTSGFPKNPTDIYVKGLSVETDLFGWAAKNSISTKDVQNGYVTLNLLQDNMQQVLNDKEYLIYVLRDNTLLNFTN